MKPASRNTAHSQATPTDNSSRRLVLQILTPKKRMLSVPFSRELIVGRVDPREQTQPDIDLTSVKAEESGVSRFHARFTYQEGTLYIEDMGSTNGTRINGFDLVAGKSYRLTPGDEIELGSLRLTAQVITNDKRRRQ